MKKKIKVIFLVFIILSLVLGGIYLKRLTGCDFYHLDAKKIESMLRNNNKFSVLIYMLLNFIRPIFMVIPVWIFSVASGAIYGIWFGSLYALIGVFISATVAFYLAKWFGRGFFMSKFGEKFRGIDNKLNRNGFKVLFVMRATVVFPFDPLSFVAGLSKMNYKTYITATVLGSIPETIVFNVLGAGFKSILSIKSLIILSLVGIIIFLFFYLRKKVVC